ncbi:MAG TPA: FliA/WhiG family RNA polymerase sigma factor [Candidatus Binatia bacterium]|nr:FliA/WhiG family RNA polymerase sigma factor [Candidatus Binatia bacterium]
MIASGSGRRAEAEAERHRGGRRGTSVGRSRKDRPARRTKRAVAAGGERSASRPKAGPARAERAAGARPKPEPSTRPANVQAPLVVSDDDVRTYLPLVRQVVQRMLPRKPPEVATEDLISWGVVGLLDAMRKYDCKREASFSTYAQYRIRGSILDYLRRCDWLPRSIRQRSHDVEAATMDLEHRLGRPPAADEVASAMGMSVEEYSQTLWTCGSVSLVPTAELCFGRGEETLSGDDVLSDVGESGPMSRLLRKERLEILADAIAELPEKERIVVSFYYFEGLTMREVADALHLTEGRISQLHSQAMSRLRGRLTDLRNEGDLLD